MDLKYPSNHQNCAMIHIDHSGKVICETSSPNWSFTEKILPQESVDRFLDVVYGEFLLADQKPPQNATSHPRNDQVYILKIDLRYPSRTMIPVSFLAKRQTPIFSSPESIRNVSPHSEVPYRNDSSSLYVKIANLTLGNEEDMMSYYVMALRDFQQVNCQVIAKSFIKVVEPKKQVKHPYNGGKVITVGTSVTRKGNPEKTKPKWWPFGVQHKEPDHLPRSGMVRK
jgi:hypothetical protein